MKWLNLGSKYINLALGFGTTLLCGSFGKRLNIQLQDKVMIPRVFFISFITALLCGTRQILDFSMHLFPLLGGIVWKIISICLAAVRFYDEGC